MSILLVKAQGDVMAARWLYFIVVTYCVTRGVVGQIFLCPENSVSYVLIQFIEIFSCPGQNETVPWNVLDILPFKQQPFPWMDHD